MTKPIMINGRSFSSMKDAADYYGIPYRTLQTRIQRGMTIEEAVGGAADQSTITCKWCEREWPASNYDASHKTQCKGCRKLTRLGMSDVAIATWLIHQDGPRCALCKEGYAENGGPLEWASTYCGEETELYCIPVCVECHPLLQKALKDVARSLAKTVHLEPQKVEEMLVSQNHTCPACEKALSSSNTRYVAPYLIHADCALDYN